MELTMWNSGEGDPDVEPVLNTDSDKWHWITDISILTLTLGNAPLTSKSRALTTLPFLYWSKIN